MLAEATLVSCLAPRPVHLLGSSSDVAAAALTAGSVAGMLNHRREAEEMAAEAAAAAGQACEHAGNHGSRCGGGTSASAGGGTSLTAVCLVAAPGGDHAEAASPAAAAMLRVLQRHVPGLTACTVGAGSLLDDEWLAMSRADVIVLDMPAGPAAVAGVQQHEQHVAAAYSQLAAAGLLELCWQRHWAGALLVGVGQGCALLGATPAGCSCQPDGAAAHAASAPAVLPWYHIRAGGGAAGWAVLHAALSSWRTAQGSALSTRLGVGVMEGGAWLVSPTSGQAELLLAPSRDTLVATAAWAAQPGNQAAAAGLEEVEDGERGFFCELAAA